MLAGGFGSAVAEVLADEEVATPLLRLGIPDQFLPYGKRDLLLAELGLIAVGIAERVSKASTAWVPDPGPAPQGDGGGDHGEAEAEVLDGGAGDPGAEDLVGVVADDRGQVRTPFTSSWKAATMARATQ